jgi:hypothetical protein
MAIFIPKKINGSDSKAHNRVRSPNMIMHIQINSAAKALDKCDQSRLDFGPLETSFDRLVHVILTNRGANDRMDRGGEVL